MRLAPGVLSLVSIGILPGLLAAAPPTPAELCTASKARAAARGAGKQFACFTRAALVEGSPSPDCIAAAEAIVDEGVARAGTACPGDPATIRNLAFGCVPFLSGIGGPRCTAAKMDATGDKVVARIGCLARAFRAGRDPDRACIARADARFAAAFAHADSLGPCGGDAGNIEQIVDYCLARLRVGFTCGNGVIDPGEECDGQPYVCGASCALRRTVCCMAGPLCGDLPSGESGDCPVFGGSLAPGFCVPSGEPCPNPGGDCTGTCEDPAIPPTTVCCQQDAGCNDTTATMAVELRVFMAGCVAAGGQNVLGTCGASGRCVPAP